MVWFWTWFAESAPWTSQCIGHLDRKLSRYEGYVVLFTQYEASIQCLSPGKIWLHRYVNCWCVEFSFRSVIPTQLPCSPWGASARMGSFTIDGSLGFGLAVLGFLLKARTLTKCSETTLLKSCLLLHFTCHWKKLSVIILSHQWWQKYSRSCYSN